MLRLLVIWGREMCIFSLESEKTKHLVAKIELSPKVLKKIGMPSLSKKKKKSRRPETVALFRKLTTSIKIYQNKKQAKDNMITVLCVKGVGLVNDLRTQTR